MKRIFDLVFSILGIIVISPFCIVVSIAIKLNDKGPVFFKQTRIGLNGKPFQILKFRSMKIDSKNMLIVLKIQMIQSNQSW